MLSELKRNGVDLLLELHVEELRLVGAAPLDPQHGAGDKGVVDHEDERVEGHLDQQRENRQLEELPP